ncbi:MAG: hypothetical protein EXS14_04025 [Planctomycetes bacterium]|nr:hypothetical protein [Planctomycetota bacterium]
MLLVAPIESEEGQAIATGARAALTALGLDPALAAFGTADALAKPTVIPELRLVVAAAPRARVQALAQAAAKRGVPLCDAGRAGLGGSLDPDPAEEGADAAWWLCAPFAHHDVLVLQGSDPSDKAEAAAFATRAKALDSLKRVEGPLAMESAAALKKRLRRAAEDGITAVFCAASAPDVLAVAEAARECTPALVVLASSRALAVTEKALVFPEGLVVMDFAPPTLAVAKELPDAAKLALQSGVSALRALAAFDAVVSVYGAGVVKSQESGGALRPGVWLRSRGSDARRLLHAPVWLESGTWKALYPFDATRPAPVQAGYDPVRGFGSLSRWSTLRFTPRAGTTAAVFHYGAADNRTIDDDLLRLKLSTGGRLPLLDHLVREKLMARLLSVTAEKYLHESDGAPVPGRSFAISVCSRKPAKMPTKRIWPCSVAGDDPGAGGRAFGSHCEIYSSFIRRTIFEQRELLERPVDALDLAMLTGIHEETGPYVTGTRRDVLYRLIEGFSGSMGLTAAHEIGHLAGLGHDEDDPCGIMNVKEGGGISHNDGHFTPTNEATLDKTLGRVPNASPKR